MAGIYDTHTHLNDGIYIEMDTTSREMIKAANDSGVGILNVVGYDIKSSKIAIRQANEYPNVYAVVGIHPNEAHFFTDDAYELLDDMANSDNVVAIGEIGLDYTRTQDFIDHQKSAFIKQLKIAKKHNLPVVLHIKDLKGKDNAYNDAIEILKSEKVKNAVIHSYEGSLDKAKEFVSMGYSISISGEITYKDKKELEEVVRHISLNNLMIETDAPYSTPVPFKGQINYPKYAGLVAERIAVLKKMDVDDIISATRTNAQKFFNV